MKIHTLAALLAAACIGSGSAAGQQIGDAVNGHVLSQRLCGDCHAVEPGAVNSPRSGAPAFAVVANTPGMTGMALSAWLHSDHHSMPLVRLESRSREDISAYILSLKTRTK